MDALKTFGKTARGAWIGWIGLLALVGLLVVTGHLASKLRPDKMYKWLFNIATIATCWAQFPSDLRPLYHPKYRREVLNWHSEPSAAERRFLGMTPSLITLATTESPFLHRPYRQVGFYHDIELCPHPHPTPSISKATPSSLGGVAICTLTTLSPFPPVRRERLKARHVGSESGSRISHPTDFVG